LRLASLDAFRGFAIASMVLVNNPGDWDHVYAPLAHAPWHGWTFTDLVFPYFLFAAGVSLPLSLERRVRAGDSRALLVRAMARRALVIFLVGLGLNAIPAFDLSTLRIPGVLQRIALCLAIAAPVAIACGTRGILAAIALLLAAYTVPMLLVPVADPSGTVVAGALEPGRDFGSAVDRALLGNHLWSQSRTWDPEGLVSTAPAAASLLFGVLAGKWLQSRHAPAQQALGLAVAGCAFLYAGLVLDAVLMPINKNLWTPSYCVFMTGWSLVTLAAFMGIMEAAREPARRIARMLLQPFIIYGMNALVLFAFSGLVARLLGAIKAGDGNLKAMLYAPIRALPISAENASLAYAIAFNAAMFAVAWFLWTKRWFVKA
jgi:predicted acyltransferase